ncbi:MAG: hypothetical protein CMJ83_10915 [Planctomycetes bacterium]|nr:hypothetical protein [Planctomycetota bacterium]
MRLLVPVSRTCPSLTAILLLSSLAVTGSAQTVQATVEGAAAVDQVGRTLLLLPDVDGDQRADYATGSPFRAAVAGPLAGVVEIRSGATGVVLLTLQGDTSGERFGSSLAATDVTGNGAVEILVGAPLYDGAAGVATGRVTAWSLPAGNPILTVEGVGAGDRFGSALCTLADLTGDGRKEFAVGAPLSDGTGGANVGRVTVHSSSTGTELGAFEGAMADDRLGTSLANLGDIDADFMNEIAAGAPFFDGPAGVDAGRVYILTSFAAMTGSIDGLTAGENFGSSIAGPGDLDADGRPDLVVAADAATTAAGTFAGRVDAFSGSTLAALWSREGTEAGARFGSSVAGGGDQDGDLRAEVVAGARLHDGTSGFDAGRVALLSPLDGSELFAVEGPAAFGQYGFAVAGGGDLDFDGRPDSLVAAPFFPGAAGVQSGRVDTIRLDPPLGRQIGSYAVGAEPVAVTTTDADGDGDQDIVVACLGDRTLRILWNGTHDPTPGMLGPGVFDAIPQTSVTLDPGADPVSVHGGQMDADAPAELAVGRRDGTVEVVDGTGTTAAPVFTPVPGLITVDTRSGAGPVASLALVSPGVTAQLAVALAGTPVLPGEIRLVSNPLTVPSVGAALANGGSFVKIESADLDGDLIDDLVATNAALGPAGGIHVLLGPAFGPAAGTPFVIGSGIPLSAAVAALDPDGIADDVLVAGIGLASGGAGVLSDFVVPTGFSQSVSTAGLDAARDIAPWSPSPTLRGAAVVDGLGNLFLLDGWTGAAFTSTQPFPVGHGVVDVEAAQLTNYEFALAADCNGEELVAAVRLENAVRVIRQGIEHVLAQIPATGCPAGASTATQSFIGLPVLGDSSFALFVNNAAPLVPAFFIAQLAPQTGSPPTVFAPAGCGYITYINDFIILNFMTSAGGTAGVGVPVPNNPGLLCAEFAVQWLLADGGPIAGVSASDAWIVRFGEF